MKSTVLLCAMSLVTAAPVYAQQPSAPILNLWGEPAHKVDPGNNDPPPAGAILDLTGTPIPGGGNSTYQMYTVNFTASLANTAITFAFREDPAFLSFSNASVVDLTAHTGNLLVNGDFSGPVYNSNSNGLTPVGWVYANVYGVTYGGVVAMNCGVGPGGSYGVGNCFYDGGVQGYDAITQSIATVPGHTYQISFWLADNDSCEIDGGPPCNFSQLSTNGDTTDVRGNGIDLTVYAAAALPSPAAIHFELGKGAARPNNPNQSILALASAMTTAGNSANMQVAANGVGFDHFNWLQFDRADSVITACSADMSLPGCASLATISGTVPNLPTVDPPLGGWAYEYWDTVNVARNAVVCPGAMCPAFNQPVQDYWSPYWDEYFAPGATVTIGGNGYTPYTASPMNPEYLSEYRQGNSLLAQVGGVAPAQALGFAFSDRASSAGGASISFVTALVGVTGSCNLLISSNCGFQIFPGTTFKWTTTNGTVGFSATPGGPLSLARDSAVNQIRSAKLADDFPLNPVDLTGEELEGAIISIDDFLSLAGLTRDSLAAIGGGISIFSGSLIPSQAAALAAQLGGPPVAQVSATTLDFPTLAYGSSETMPLTVTNIGGGTLTFTTFVHGPSYKVLPGSDCGAGLAAGASCTLQIEFLPRTVELHKDILTLTTNGAANPVVLLHGTATGVGTTNETGLHFGAISLGSTATLPLHIANSGVAGSTTSTFSIDGPDYEVLPGSVCATAGVAAGKVCTIQVDFAPLSAGYHRNTLTITSASGTVSTVMLDGTGNQ